MLRALIYAITLLHLGPGVAFALLAFGCDGDPPAIGEVCRNGTFASFAALTAGGWIVMGTGFGAVYLVNKARSSATSSTARLWSLLAILSFGLLAGASGLALTGSQLWFLAIPACLAAGWLLLANPHACLASAGSEPPRSPGSGAA